MKWKTLDNAYVNFTHFARMREGPTGWSFTKFGIFHAWRRHVAYFMGPQFPCVDLMIPLAYVGADKTIDPTSMSYILISVKNHSGVARDSLLKQYLSEQYILGKPNKNGQYVNPDGQSKTNLLLSLGRLPFIYLQNVGNYVGDIAGDVWLEISERNPYIAFVMSIGSGGTIEGERTFVPELQVLRL